MSILILFVQLFATFFLIGMFTFGGGYAMLSLIQTQVVVTHHWITESAFTDIVAISQMTPGPVGINCATYTGYQVMINNGAGWFTGVLGSFTATIALALPSFIIVLLMVRFYEKVNKSHMFKRVMSWIRPTVVGLIGAAAVILIFKTTWSGTPGLSMPDISIIRDNFVDWKSWVLFGAAMVASLYFKVNPILIIVGGGVLGFLLY